MAPMIIWALQFIIIIAPKTQSARTISDSNINQYEEVNCASETVVHSGHTAVSLSNVQKCGGQHDSTQAFVRAWYVACRKSSAMLVPASRKFVLNNLLFQGPCQSCFIFKLDGMIAAPQNPESEQNSNEWLQFAKLESFTVIGRGVIDEQGAKLWTCQCRSVSEQRSVGLMERLVKGRKLLQPPKPKPDRGHGPQHN